MEKKETIKLVIDGIEYEAKHKAFKSGKEGFGFYGIIKINDYPYRVSMNIIRL